MKKAKGRQLLKNAVVHSYLLHVPFYFPERDIHNREDLIYFPKKLHGCCVCNG